MKAVFSISILFPALVFAQIKLQNLSLQFPDSNVLYLGIDNNLQILGTRDFSKVRLEMQGLVVKPGSDGSLVIRTAIPGISQLKIYNKSKLIFSKPYQVCVLAAFRVTLGRYRDTT